MLNIKNIKILSLKSSFIEDFLSDLRRLFSKGYHKIMEPMEASAKSTDPEEVIDLQDDHLMHRDDDAQPEPEQVLDEVLTNDIEKDPPVVKAAKAKRPRTKAQQEAFKKAQTALKAKREKERQVKASQPKKARGRPTKPKKKKETTVVFEESSESDYSTSESSSEEEVVYVQRKKKSQPQKKPKKPKAPKVVYVTDSSDEEVEMPLAPNNWINFV